MAIDSTAAAAVAARHQAISRVRGGLDGSAPRHLVFGFDLGIGSVGFAAIDDGNEEILFLASHLSSAPEVPKNHKSLAEQRRGYRSTRRRLDRAKVRTKKIKGLLVRAGLVPDASDAKWFETRKGDARITALRAAALDRPLTDRELARVLMYYARHRGYIDQSTGGATDSEDGKVLAAIAANVREMREKGWRTAGEMLADRDARGDRTRNREGEYDLCIPHNLIRDEAALIIDRQRELGRAECTAGFKAEYLAILSWLKPTYARDLKVYGTVGHCTYAKNLAGARAGNRASKDYARRYLRAASATLTAEREAALERLAHITLLIDGRKAGLPHGVRMALYEKMFDPGKKVPAKGVTFKQVRALLNKMGPNGPETMRETDRFIGVKLDEEGKATVYRPAAFAKLQDGLKDRPALFKRLVGDIELYDDIAEALTFASSRESYLHRLSDLGVDERLQGDDLQAVRDLPFNSKVFKSYASRSREKLGMLIQALCDEGVRNLYEAEEATGLYAYRSAGAGGKGAFLPPYDRFDPGCSNPVVLHAAARFRKVFNAAVREFGKPDIVRIEFARDLKASAKARREVEKSNKKRRERNAEDRGELACELGIEPEEVKGSLLEKRALYKTQNGIDPYTGESISYERLLADDAYTETDHIIPRSRSFDNRMTNKVLTLTRNNRNKGNRTPYEWMNSGEESAPSWEEFKARVQKLHKGFPPAKYRNLLDTDFAEREHDGRFIERNLNDTRYLSRMFAEWIKAAISFDEPDRQHVFAVSGGATANLRRVWGIRKDRGDGGRHHAADAAVIAACDPALVRKCAEYGATRGMLPPEDRDGLLKGTMPWPGFADQVRAIAAGITPTRSESHGFSGQATEDTAFSFAGYNEKGKMLVRDGEGNVKAVSNHVVVNGGDGTVKPAGGMAFLRLWLDPEAKGRGGRKGEYLCEPVYYGDLPMIDSGDYRPRYCKQYFPCRQKWPLIPNELLDGAPVAIYKGDAVVVDGTAGRFVGFDISARAIKWGPLFDNVPTPPPLSAWDGGTYIEVVNEDVLGLCWERVRRNLERHRS